MAPPIKPVPGPRRTGALKGVSSISPQSFASDDPTAGPYDRQISVQSGIVVFNFLARGHDLPDMSDVTSVVMIDCAGETFGFVNWPIRNVRFRVLRQEDRSALFIFRGQSPRPKLKFVPLV